MKTVFIPCRIYFVCFMSLVGFGCSDNQVSISPRYVPGSLKSYSLETFLREWKKTDGTEGVEIDVLQDLTAHAPADFPWTSFWTSWADSEIQLPQSKKAKSFILNANIPKCRADSVEGFAAFVTFVLRDIELGAKSLRLLLDESCSAPVNAATFKVLGSKLVWQQSDLVASEIFNQRDAYLLKYLKKISSSSDLSQVLDPSINWRSYFEDQIQSAPRLSSEFLYCLNLYSLLEGKAFSPDQNPRLIDSVLRDKLTWDPRKMDSLATSWGAYPMVQIYGQAFRKSEYDSLDLDSKLKVVSLIAKFTADLHGSEFVDGFYALAGFLMTLPDDAVLANYLSNFDKALRNEMIRLSGRADTERSQVLETIRVKTPPSDATKAWLVLHLSGTQTPILNVNERDRNTSLLNKLLYLRVNLRSTLNDQRLYRRILKEACQFYDEHGITRPSTNLAPEARGCFRVSDHAIKLLSQQDLDLSPDLLLIAPNAQIDFQIAGRLTYGFFDVSPDSSHEVPTAPAPVAALPEDSEVMFPVIIGYRHGEEEIYFPFHFEARRQVQLQDPRNLSKGVLPVPPLAGNKVNGFATRSIFFTTIISNGSDGRPGLAPEFGGKGDVSHAIENYEDNFEAGIQPIAELMGVKILYHQTASLMEWRKIVENYSEMHREGKERFILINERFYGFLSQDDRKKLKAYLSTLRPEVSELAAYCEKLKNDKTYSYLLDDFGQLSEESCLRVFAMEKLASEVAQQVLQSAHEANENKRYDANQSFVVPDSGMSLPGPASPAGNGGEIRIEAESLIASRISARPGLTFSWPLEWNAQPRNGLAGSEGQILVKEAE